MVLFSRADIMATHTVFFPTLYVHDFAIMNHNLYRAVFNTADGGQDLLPNIQRYPR